MADKQHPEQAAPWWSKATFWWINPLIKLGYERPLQIEDIDELPETDRADHLVEKFQSSWDKEVDRATTAGESPSLLKALYLYEGTPFLKAAMWKVIHDFALFVGPLVLKELLHWVADKSVPGFWGFIYVLLFFTGNVLILTTINQYFHILFRTSLHLRVGLISALYRKAMTLTCTARQEMTIGKITNLMSTDSQKLGDTIVYLHVLWSSPLQIIICLVLLYDIIGPSVFMGLGVMCLLIPIQSKVAKLASKYRKERMKHMDDRVKITNEVLHGIRVIKMYAWEEAFTNTVEQMRTDELVQLRKSLVLGSWASAISNSVVLLVTLVTFTVYVLIGNTLDAPTAFTSLALFGVLRFPLAMLPNIITRTAEAYVSVKRLNKYFNMDDLKPLDFAPSTQSQVGVYLNDATFDWSAHKAQSLDIDDDKKKNSGKNAKSEAEQQENDDDADGVNSDSAKRSGPALQDINLECSGNEMLAVVGGVGSGKSSLLQGILGEIPLTMGTQLTKGSVAYVPQQAFIQNATVKENILFGKEFNSARYTEAIRVCALEQDIEILPAGDMTEIGEKGINLSGGQKQRISLARAVYKDADVYLLDDPLSAVDSHVSLHIFEECINGLLADKIRVFATNQLQYIRHSDRVLVLDGGKMSASGTYDELMENDVHFNDLITKFAGTDKEEGKEVSSLNDNYEEMDTPKLTSSDAESKTASLEEIDVKDMELDQDGQEEDAEVSDDEGNLDEDGESVDEDDDAGLLANQQKGKSKGAVVKLTGKSKDSKGDAEDAENGSKLIQKEEREVGTVKSEVYVGYLKVLGTTLFVVWLAISFLLVQGTILGSDFWLAWWTDDHHDLEVWAYLLGYAGWTLASALASYNRGVSMAYGNYNASLSLHRRLFSAVVHAPVTFFDTTPVGRIINRFSKDLDEIDSVLSQNLMWLFGCLTVVFTTLIVISVITPWFMVPMLPIMYVYYLFQKYYRFSSRELKRIDSISRSPIFAHFSETLGGLPTIRAYQEQNRFVNENHNKLDQNMKAYFVSNVGNRWLDVRLQMIGNTIVCSAAFFAVLSRDVLPPGLVGLSITQALKVTGNLNWAIRMFANAEKSMNAMERVQHYGKLEGEAPFRIDDTTPESSWPREGGIQFVDYSMRYRPELDLALKNINLEIKPREKVGIVGRTGSGKSSMMVSLLRMCEAAQGKIVIDGIDVSKIGLFDLRSKVSIIPQDPEIFSGTLRGNVDPFGEYTDALIWEALERAHMKDKVASMDQKLEEPVAEAGENFSVGEKQLLCLARALIRGAKIILLDECTAAIDAKTDELVQETIRTEFADCTVLTIAHRLHTIITSDRILVLDQGEVSEFDTPESLLENPKSLFSGLVDKTGSATSKVLRAMAKGEMTTFDVSGGHGQVDDDEDEDDFFEERAGLN